MNIPVKVFLVLLLWAGPVWAAVECDATDDEITTADEADLDIDAGDMTICAWLWLENTFSSPDWRNVAGKWNDTANDRSYTLVMNNTTDRDALVWFVETNSPPGSTQSVDSTTTQSGFVDAWKCACGTFDDSADEMELFIDGVSEGTATTEAEAIDNSTREFMVCNHTSDSAFWDGKIDEVAIWASELSPTDITQYCNSRVKGVARQLDPSNLRLYWPLDEVADGASADGSTFNDREGAANNDGTGDNGANNTGMLGRAGEIQSYP